ncbi:retrovirus-related pol polyprotein from transposon TNT 1-94 [Tanacetum coccineum]|uniref:Retrovirus-related pol polyprotein from transposon TNT 1-94 n=1 Tax=Tanacetum coccineum TaxID=301880 RepID=A0ABQ4ZDW9_9ASTR
MMTKSKICYDHSSKQAIGFEKPFCLKKARESMPKLYDGNTILKMDTIVVPDSDETLELSEKSRVRLSTCASGSQPSGNTKKDRILQAPSSNSKNKVEAHPRNVKSSSNKKNGTVNVSGSAVVQNLKKQDNSDCVGINSNDCMSSDNVCVSNAVHVVKSRAKPNKNKPKKVSWKPTGKVFTQIGYTWRPTGRTFTIVGNACPLTRITTTNEVPSRKPIVLDSKSPKPVVKLVYSRKPRKNNNAESVSNTKVVQIVLWYLDSGCSKHMTGDRSQLTNFVSKFLGTVKFGNDQVAKIMGFGDYQIGNVTISRVYYVEGLGHNLFSVGQFCDSNGVRLSTCASGSQPSDNTKKDRILQAPSSNSKNKVEAQPRNAKSSLNKKNGTVNVSGSAVVQNLKKQDNSDCVGINSNDCMSYDNVCVSNAVHVVKSRAKPNKNKPKKDSWKPTGKVFTQIGYTWRPTGRTFTIVGNACPLTRITTTNEVPSRKPIVLDSKSPKPVVKLVYSRKPRKNKHAESVSNTKVVQIVLWYLDSGCSKHMTGDRSQLTNFVSKFLGTVKFGNDQVAKIMGFGDYQIGNVTISRVYYVEGLGHNLFSVGQLCDSNLEVAFRQHTCFIRNLEGVDLLTGSRGDNLYTLSLGNMMASSPICLLSKASKTKSWLWHRRLSHLNFGSINHLARHGLVRGLPKLKFEKDHLCSACALGKSSKKPHKPKSEDTNQEKLYLLHMDLCGPMRVASVNGKKYILVIVDDYSRFTWVKCLRSKDEAPAFIINFLKMIQVRLKETVRRIRTDNGTEFVNQTLREYYEKVGISHETSVARSPQQNGVVERRNRTLIEAARTMLIYAKAPLFLWAEAVATACYTQNRSMIRRRHGKTPYELLHNKPPDLSYLHVFGALCYPTNDSENLGKLQPKADIGIFIGYAPTKKAFRIYNRRTRRIIETIHVDFDELTAMASEHSSSGPALHEIPPKYGYESCEPVDSTMVRSHKLDRGRDGKA